MSNAQRATFAHLQHRLHTNGPSPNPAHPQPQSTFPLIPTLPFVPLNPHLTPTQPNPSSQSTGILGSVTQAFGEIQGAGTYPLPMQQYPQYNWNQQHRPGTNQPRHGVNRGGHLSGPHYRNRDSNRPSQRNIHKSNTQTGQGEVGENGTHDQQKDDEYFCDPCDKSFRSKSQYETHLQKHVPCEHEGCKFTGIPKALDSHKELMHSLSRKMMPLETPEEIQKYIEERKKNFPTKENVLKKEEAMKATVEQGGLDTDPKKKRKFNDDIRNRGKKRNRQPFMGIDKSDPEVEKSTAHLTGGYEEGEVQEDEDEDTNQKEGKSGAFDQREQPTNKAICRFMKRGHCRRGKRCNFSHDIPSDKSNQPKNTKTQSTNTKDTDNEAASRKSLLEKLLEPEIKHEISIILQAIRHLNKAGLLGESRKTEK